MTDALFATVRIPYGGGTMPGYLFRADDSGKPRPTVIYTNGFGSGCEEGYFVVGAAALRRGYNFLAYDGPGQGAMLREQKVTMRPDWENVLGPSSSSPRVFPRSTPTRSCTSAMALAATWSRDTPHTAAGRPASYATTA